MLGSSKKNKFPSATPKMKTSTKYQKKGVNFVRSPQVESGHRSSLVCHNSACRAIISKDDKFCKRCSCHICKKFDENKDPSLWFVCTDEDGDGGSCGLSCHLECILEGGKKEGGRKEGDAEPQSLLDVDGGYLCECGKVSSILGCWKRQLTVAKDTRCVDVLRERISLSHRLLKGTPKFKELHDIIQEALGKLEEVFGTITELSVKKPIKKRGIVARNPVAIEVQTLCALAIQRADESIPGLFTPDPHYRGSYAFRFNESTINKTHNSVCKAPTFDLNVALVPDLNEEITPPSDTSAGFNTNYGAASVDSENKSPRSNVTKKEEVYVEKINENENVSFDYKFENCVKLICELERDGHIKEEFRRKFLTWFGLRSSERDRRVIYAFIESFSGNPNGLVGQLVDTFTFLENC